MSPARVVLATLGAGFLAALLIASALLDAKAKDAEARGKSGPAPRMVIAICGEYPDFAERLKRVHGEVPVARGQVGPETLLVVFASDGGGTFTVLRVMASGKACVVTSGLGWDGENYDRAGGGL